MVKELSGWLADVVSHNLRRPVLRVSRFKPLISLRSSILEVKRYRNAIIAEYKTKSPSGLNIYRDPIEYIRIVEKVAAGISVLTEELYFGGSYLNCIKIASATPLPILMKDFVVSEAQIETAYNVGADAVLLIASILTDKELERLYSYAKSYGLEVLVEVHSLNELEQALTLKPDIIGVNSRNLRTLTVDLSRAVEVLKHIPAGYVKVAESGIRCREDVERLRNAGADAFLIGSELMLNPLKAFELGLTT